jgi:protein disulfide-isomerase-like protein
MMMRRYELIRAVKKRFGLESSLRIYRAKDASTREEFEKLYGAHLWRGDPHLFDFLTKVEPMHRALNDMNTMAWVTGRRKSQGGERSKLQIVELDAGDGRLKFNPLANWSGDQVWKYIKENKVPYNELHDKGYSSVGDMVTTEKTEPGKNEREGRFKGQNRTECGMHVATTGEGLEAMKKKAAIIAKGYKWELKERSHTESVGIVQITQENFEDMVATSQNNVLLEVYAPWCGHCQHFAPIYSKAGQLLINGKIKGDITVARMDGYQNKIPEQYQQMFPIKGFPTIFLHLKGSKEQPLVYDGQRHEAEALYNWVENHVSDHAAYN